MRGERLLDVKAVTEKTTLSRSKIYVMVQEGAFPPPLKVASQTVRSRESTVDARIEGLPLSSL